MKPVLFRNDFSAVLRSWKNQPFVRALVALGLVFIIGCIFNADQAFFKWDTHRDMLRHVAVFGILACGMTLVIIAGGIDLSVGSVLGFTTVTFSLLTMHRNWPAAPAIVVTLLAGAACGVASGALAGRFRIQPFLILN